MRTQPGTRCMEPEPATTAKFLLDQAVSLSPLEPAQFTGLASTGSCNNKFNNKFSIRPIVFLFASSASALFYFQQNLM